MTDIKWVDPSVIVKKERRSTAKWLPKLEALKTKPGEWAELGSTEAGDKNLQHVASCIRGGKYVGIVKDQYEAIAQSLDEGSNFTLYARFVGGPEVATTVEPAPVG